MANEKIIKQKEEEVKALADQIKDAKLVLLTDYRGINVTDVTNLRKTLRGTSSDYKVIKNNITRRAFAEFLTSKSNQHKKCSQICERFLLSFICVLHNLSSKYLSIFSLNKSVYFYCDVSIMLLE